MALKKDSYIEKEPSEKQQFYWVGLLYFLNKTCIERHGKKGERAVRKGIRNYGQERGERMRRYTDSLGVEPTLKNMSKYYDLMDDPRFDGGCDVLWVSPEEKCSIVHRCPDFEMWDCLPDGRAMGRIFCEEVHHRIFGGYDPAIQLNLCETMTRGDDCCRFFYFFRECNRNPYDIGPNVEQPWDDFRGKLVPSIHTMFGLMLIQMGKVILDELDEETLREALYRFSYHRGERMRELHRREGMTQNLQSLIEVGDLYLDERYAFERKEVNDTEAEIKVKRCPLKEMFATYGVDKIREIYCQESYRGYAEGYGLSADCTVNCDNCQGCSIQIICK